MICPRPPNIGFEELEKGLFTSDLSVNEFLLVKEAGFHPVGFVMGSWMYLTGIRTRKWSQSQELTKLTEAMYNARELAMTRMDGDCLGRLAAPQLLVCLDAHFKPRVSRWFRLSFWVRSNPVLRSGFVAACDLYATECDQFSRQRDRIVVGNEEARAWQSPQLRTRDQVKRLSAQSSGASGSSSAQSSSTGRLQRAVAIEQPMLGLCGQRRTNFAQARARRCYRHISEGVAHQVAACGLL